MDVVFFDAAGTLFKVRGSVGEIYSRIAEHYRVVADPKRVELAFRTAFHAKSLEGFPSGEQPGLRAEKAWWMDVVRRVFGETMKPEDLRDYFDEVFEAFRSRQAWELYEDTRPGLERLRAGGYRLAVISNFDSRLFDVLANLEVDFFFAYGDRKRKRRKTRIIRGKVCFSAASGSVFSLVSLLDQRFEKLQSLARGLVVRSQL